MLTPRSYSPAVHSWVGPVQSTQVNVDSLGRNIVGDAANEPSICVDPTNRQRIAIAWRQFDSVLSNFRQAGYAYSENGGKTWTFPGVLEAGVFRSDPVLVASPSGRFLYLSLKSSFFDDDWGSDDGGAAWVREGDATGGDKQWMTIDPTNGIGRGNLYQAWSTAGNNWGGRQFSRSTDGGYSWSNPINIPHSPFWGTLDVGPSGQLYLCGTDGSQFWFVRSTNARDKTQTPVFDLSTPVNLGGQIEYGGINPDGLCGQAWIATDRSTGPYSGNIYMLCSVHRGSNDPCDVMFSRSADGGATWSSPRRINDDPAGRGAWHWFGALSVAPDGRIDVAWYDTRNDPTHASSALTFSQSFDGGQTWSANVQISQPFHQGIGYPNQNKIGDYIGVAADNDGSDVSYTATFNGEEDVYFARVAAPKVLMTPKSVATLFGFYEAGVLSDLYAADGRDYTVISKAAGNLGQAAMVLTQFSLPRTDVDQLLVRMTASSQVQATGQIFLYDWASARFESAKTLSMPGAMTKLDSMISGAGKYVSPSGAVRMLMQVNTPGTNPPRFALQVDQLSIGY